MIKFKWIFLAFLTIAASFVLAPSVLKEVSATKNSAHTQQITTGNGYAHTPDQSIRTSLTIICKSLFNDEDQYMEVYTISPNAPKESIDIWRQWLAGSK